MKSENAQSFGSIIGLKPEYEERYIALHRHTFPEVLERIRRSNISDYSIFLLNGILFGHLIYTGEDYEADMEAIGTNTATQEWWKLTDPMQQPLEYRKKNEWWAELEPWFISGNKFQGKSKPYRFAYYLPLSSVIIERLSGGFAKSTDFLEAYQDLHCLKIFKGIDCLYLYMETFQPVEMPSLLQALCRELDTNVLPQAMAEVFHTGQKTTESVLEKKKVFVTGCFDLLHSGHIAFLQEAATFGDVYVSIGSDANVHHLKGRYPVNTQEERKYMLDALTCVKACLVNSGWGFIDFEKELRDTLPDFFVVNEDGHTPTKQALCKEMGIEYKVLKRIPHGNLPVRSTTTLLTECTIPFRIDLAGGWLDQPFVSKYHPGPVLTISIEPTIEFNERSGMSSSTRRKAIELWRNEIPHGDAEQLARMLFSFENPPGTEEVAGSQDSLGIVLPGLNKLDYDGRYWPEKITSINDEGILTWIEKSLYLVTLGPRVGTYSVLSNTKIDASGAKALSAATEDCWKAILKKDIQAFGDAFRRSFEAQVAMFPNMVDEEILQTIEQYKDKAWGWKLSGAGGGGYLIMVSHEPIEGAMQIKIRRGNNF